MKSPIPFICLFSIFFVAATAQNSETSDTPVPGEKAALTLGILQGGGALVGGDLEFLILPPIGIQIGGGLVGYGAGINIHLKKHIRSSFISLQYWHQGGSGDAFVQSVVGPNFVVRVKKWFTVQIGLGHVLDRGPAFPNDLERRDFILMYAIGGYFPLARQ